MLLHGNEILNLITITNNIYERTARCFLVYNNIYLIFLCCAGLFAYEETPIDNPIQTKDLQIPNSKYLWITFVSPIIASILQYIFAGFFKVNESKLLRERFYLKYQRLLYDYFYNIYRREIYRERKLKRLSSYIALVLVAIGIACFCCYFTTQYGWDCSFQWLYSCLFAVLLDNLFYDPIVAFILCLIAKKRMKWAKWVQSIRLTKLAEIQE